MATTAQNVIDRACRLIGAVASGESPSTQESDDCLVALAAMIDSWQTERLMAYAVNTVSTSLSAAVNSYTIGPGATVDTTRPVVLDAAYITLNGIDYGLEIIDQQAYYNIPNKASQSSFPKWIYYDTDAPTGTLYVWPTPSQTSTLTLSVWVPLQTLTATTDSITLPVGYVEALTYNLAVRIAPEFGRPVTPEVAKIAQESLARIKRRNKPQIQCGIEFAKRGSFNIYTGT